MCHLLMVGSDVPSGDGWDQMCHLVMVGSDVASLVMVGSDVPSGDGGIRCAIW